MVAAARRSTRRCWPRWPRPAATTSRSTSPTRPGTPSPTDRWVEPHRLVSLGRRWYLVAYDRDRQDWRSFRVDRISEPRTTGQTVPAARAARRGRAVLRPGRHPPDAAAVRRPGACSTPTRTDVAAVVGRWGTVVREPTAAAVLEMNVDSPRVAGVGARRASTPTSPSSPRRSWSRRSRGRPPGSLDPYRSPEVRSRDRGLGHTEARYRMGYQGSTTQRRHSCTGYSGPWTRSRACRCTSRWSNTGVGLVACDGSGRLTLISPALQELFGMTYEPVAEPFYVERFRLFRADGETPLATRRGAAHAGPARRVRPRLAGDARAAPTGRWCTSSATRCPLRDDEGHDIGAIALVQDVTAETQAALRAEELQQAAGRDDQPRVPYAAGRAARPRRADPRPPRPSRDLDPELAGWLDAIERSGWRLRDLVQEIEELVNGERRASPPTEQPGDRRPRRMRAV